MTVWLLRHAWLPGRSCSDGTCILQAKAHNSNLWVDKHGHSKTSRPDAMVGDGPVVRKHWPLAVLWVIGAVIKVFTIVEFNKYAHLPDSTLPGLPLLSRQQLMTATMHNSAHPVYCTSASSLPSALP